jgi:hypothetical protein
MQSQPRPHSQCERPIRNLVFVWNKPWKNLFSPNGTDACIIAGLVAFLGGTGLGFIVHQGLSICHSIMQFSLKFNKKSLASQPSTPNYYYFKTKPKN